MNTDPTHPIGIPVSTIVVYDGACGICQTFVSWLVRLDRGQCLSLVAYQKIDPNELPVVRSPVMMQQAMQLIDSQGRQYSGARAVFEAFRRLPGIWGLVGTVFANSIMSWLAEPFYRLFAHHRTTVFCMLHTRVSESTSSDQQLSSYWEDH